MIPAKAGMGNKFMVRDFSGTYSIKELFNIGPIVSVAQGHSGHYLTEYNCKIVNKTFRDDFIILDLEGEGQNNNLKGTSDVKVRPEFIARKDLLTKFFSNSEIMNHKLEELKNFKMTI